MFAGGAGPLGIFLQTKVPNDLRTLLKIGDLHTQLGNIELAIATYYRVTAIYCKKGAYPKAVAVTW